MEKDWVKIFSTSDVVKADLVKDLLDNNDIPAVVLNKKETLTVIIGEVEVYVEREDAVKAVNLIKSTFDA
jgi:predicted transcriptional regulator